MDKELQFLEGIFNSEVQDLNIFIFLFQILMCGVLCLGVAFFYSRFGNSLSNRNSLAKNFVLIGLTTMIIITIVKSSLALSLGLVGALSIVRFRTAIKEPEELAYFFLIIAIGLGIGANQPLVTMIGALSICLIVFLVNKQQKSELSQNLIVTFQNSDSQNTETLISILEKHSNQLALKRLDTEDNQTEVSFVANFKSVTSLLAARTEIKNTFPASSFSFLEMV